MVKTTTPSTTPEIANSIWRKSSRTGSGSGGGGNCVEVAANPGTVAVRDSKNPKKSILILFSSQWNNLVREVKHGKFDL
jgi:hypothetical protein